MSKPNDLKLVYILKIGKNSKGEGLYEFIFSKDIDTIVENAEDLMWDQKPASSPDNAEVPDEDMIDQVCQLKTKEFDLWCLHESDLHSYMDGVYTIHCLAYEIEKENEYEDYESMYEGNDDDGVLVFHFGMSLEQVSDILYSRDITLHNGSFKHASEIKIK